MQTILVLAINSYKKRMFKQQHTPQVMVLPSIIKFCNYATPSFLIGRRGTNKCSTSSLFCPKSNTTRGWSKPSEVYVLHVCYDRLPKEFLLINNA